MRRHTIPPATVARLPIYLQCLEHLPRRQTTVSSAQLGDIAHVTPAKVRKDLSHLGSHGVRGVGYDVDHLAFQIRSELGLTREWQVVIVGIGNLGSALANYGGFNERGFQVTGLYDVDQRKVGRRVDGLTISHVDQLDEHVSRNGIAIGVIATPASAAQAVAEHMAQAGVLSILNFAPAVLDVPAPVEVRNVDLSIELQILSFYLQRTGG